MQIDTGHLFAAGGKKRVWASNRRQECAATKKHKEKKHTFVHTCSTTSKKTRCSLKLYRWFLPEPKASTLQAFPDDRSNYIHQEGARGSSSRPMLSPSFSHGIEMMLKEQANSRLFTAFVEAFSLVAAIAGQKHRIWSSIGEPYINWEYGHRLKRLQWNNSLHCIDNRLFLPENFLFGLKNGSCNSNFSCSWCSFSLNLRFCEPH